MNFQVINQTKNKEFAKFKPKLTKIYNKTKKILKFDKVYFFSVILVEDDAIQQINKEYRNIDKVTDVISFASLDHTEGFEVEQEEVELGDIFINVNRTISQAQEYGHSLEREYCFLFTHGLLHLLGYDHMCEEDELEMKKMQDEILGGISER